MSVEITYHVVYRCDSCGLAVVGFVHTVPEGWRAEHTNLVSLHYCPCTPPEEPRQP